MKYTAKPFLNVLKRAALCCLLLFLCPTSALCADASAAQDILYDDLTAACRDVRAAVYARQTQIAFSLTDTAVSGRSQSVIRDILTDVLEGYVDYSIGFEPRDGMMHVVISGTIRPALRMLDAWETGDRSALTDEEVRCLNMALNIAADCRKDRKSALEIERAVYDAVCRYVSYTTLEELPPFGSEAYIRLNSCIGGLLDGETTCMGYAEVFYLIAQLAGLDVQMQYGFPGGGAGGKHAWNVVRIGTQRYTVDACWGDVRGDIFEPTTPDYRCFNTALNLMSDGRYAHPEAQIAEISETTDMSHSAFGAAKGGMSLTTLDEAIDYAIACLRNGQPYAHVLLAGQTISLSDVDSAMRLRIQDEAIKTKWGRMTYSFAGGTYLIIRWVL